MREGLLDDRPPIEAGPIVIGHRLFDGEPLPGEYIHYHTFVIEALSHNIDQSKATKAMILAVRGLIEHLELGILPPFEELEGDQPWGPYGVHDYCIEAHAYAKNANAIVQYALEATEDNEVLAVLGHVRSFAESIVRHDTDKIPLSKLPGAFHTPIYPIKRINSGRVLSYRDFKNAAVGARTSGAKTAALFDSIVNILGNEEAREVIALLEIYGNPTTRQQIRQSLYIKTQALADLIESFHELDPEIGSRFNALSLDLLRYILYDEEH